VNEESTNPSKVIDTTSAESKNSTVREKAPAHSVIDLAKLDESNNQGENPDSSSHLIEEDTGTIWNRLRLRPRINRIQDSSRKDLESAK
jgi:hypothetical protein